MTICDQVQYSLEEVIPGYLIDDQEYISSLLKHELFCYLLCDRVEFAYYPELQNISQELYKHSAIERKVLSH